VIEGAVVGTYTGAVFRRASTPNRRADR
jgi:hypothetical protein